MSNYLRCGKDARNDILLSGSFYNRRFNIFIIIGLVVISEMDILPNYHLGRDNFQNPDHFFYDLCYDITALRIYQILTFLAASAYDHTFRNVVPYAFMLLVVLVQPHNGNILYFCLASSRENHSFIQQKTSLLPEILFAVFRNNSKLLMTGKTQIFYEYCHTAFKLRDTPAVRLEFLIFHTRNGDYFCVACFEIICLICIKIAAHFF